MKPGNDKGVIEQTGENMTLKGVNASSSFHHFSTEKVLLFISFLISLEMLLVFCFKFYSFINSKMSSLAVTFTFLCFCLYWHYIWSIVEYWIIFPLTYHSNICHYLFPSLYIFSICHLSLESIDYFHFFIICNCTCYNLTYFLS